ncbi:riboflavin synthase [Flavimarina sp. Hel_I_48]|uniref:riboflavin synthase n=1 Tax=Flavimarina sp. Hel_I_48 TaxID=1392488 RepID=UPI0004DEE216|nr:riboflavin synthase [Flavimarina sp. Hel_I_48]
MFTGIIEDLGQVSQLEQEGGNLNITVTSKLTPDLKIDQSVAHNGVCLTVVNIEGKRYTVTAIEETLQKTNLNTLETGDVINLERAMIMGARLDGHMVQGHVDQTGTVTSVEEKDGSWIFSITYDSALGNLTIEKGSITINGVSLTVINTKKDGFSVAIIPYTFAHTTFKELKAGETVNLEFDVIGKYVSRFMSLKD